MPEEKKSTLNIKPENYNSNPSSNKRDEFYEQSAINTPTIHIPMANYLEYGDSQYDTGAGADVLASGDFNELRAQRQDNWDKAGNSIGRFAGRTITSGLELAGNVYGIAKLGVELNLDPINRAAYIQEHGSLDGYVSPTWTTIFDNEVTRTLDSADALVKEWLPQYQTKDYQNSSWYEKLGYANFYFDSLADAAGFAVGSTLGAGAYTKLTSNMFKLAKAGKTAELNVFMKEAKALKEAGKDISGVAKKIDETARKIKIVDGIDKGFLMTVSGTSESGQESRSTGDEVRYKLTHDDFGNELQLSEEQLLRVDELVDEAKKTAFLGNMLVTGPTSMIVNNAAIKKLAGLKETAQASKMIKPKLDYKNLGTYSAKKGSKLGEFANATGRALANNSIESLQEMYQHGLTKGVEDYYTAKFKGKEGFDQFLKSATVGVTEAFSDEGLLAAMTGFLTPGVSNTLTTMGGNIKEGLNQFSKQEKANIAYSAMLNKNSTKKEFKALYDGATRHQAFSNQLDESIENADDFETKNQMHNIMTNLVLSRIEAGKFEDLQEDLDYFKTLSPEQFEETFGVKLDASQRETVVGFIQSKIDQVTETKKTFDNVNTVFGESVSMANRQRLTHATLAIKDGRDRTGKLSKEVSGIVMNNYSTAAHTYQGAKYALLHQDYASLTDEQKVEYRNMIPVSGIVPLDQTELISKLDDIDKLKGRDQKYVDLYNELVSPEAQATKDAEDKKEETKADIQTVVGTKKEGEPEGYNPFEDLEPTEEETREAEKAEQAQKEKDNQSKQSGVAEIVETPPTIQEPVEEVPPTDNRPVKTVLTDGKKITPTRTQKIVKRIKEFMGIHEDINNHITLKPVLENGFINVHIMLNGEHVANLNGLEDKFSNNELNEQIKQAVISSNKELSPKDLGIYFGLTDGALDIIKKEDGPLTPLSDLDIDLSLTGGQMLVYDFATRDEGKYTSGSWIGTIDTSLFKPGVEVNKNAIPNNLGRYVLVVPMINGSVKYIRVRPSKLDSLSDNATNKLFGELAAQARLVKGSLNTIDLAALDAFNAEFNRKFFIAVDGQKLKYKGKQYDGYQVNIDVEPKYGKMRVTLTGRIGEDYSTLEKIYVAADAKVGSLDSFLEVVNKEFKGELVLRRGDFKASISEDNYVSDMEAAVKPNIVKGQALVFRRANPEDFSAKASVTQEATKKQTEKEPYIKDLAEAEGDVYTDSLTDQIKELEAQIATTKNPKQLRELKKKYNELLSQLPKGDEAYKIEDANGSPLSQAEIDEVINMLPKFIDIQDISKILENLKTNGIPLGMFKDKVIYLNSVSATRGVAYHEAFHAVFRTVLNDKEINKYLSEAKKEYNSRNNSSKLRADIDKLRSYSSEYAKLSNQKLEELVYEEYLADKFAEFKKDETSKSPFRRLFIILKGLFKMFKYNSEEISALFEKISSKAFVNSELKDNRFNKLDVGLPVYTLIPAGEVARENEETGKFERFPINHTQQKSEKLISTFAARISKAKKGEYGDSLLGMSDLELFKHFVDERVFQLTDEFYEYYKQIEESDPVKAEEISAIAAKELATYDSEAGVEILKEAVQKRLAIFKYEKAEEENDEASANDQGETTEVAEKHGSQDAWLSGGHESLPKLIKQYISFSTYMEFDPVLGREVEVAVDAVTAYNGLTRILADTPRTQMIDKLNSVSNHNPNMKAVLDRLIADTGMVVNEDGTLSQPNKNFNDYQIFLNTFDNSLTKQIFTLAKEDGTYQVQPANKNDAKSLTPSSWANNIRGILQYKNINKEELAERYLAIEDLFNSGIKKPVTTKQLNDKVDELAKAFELTGIKLSKGFIEYSLLKIKQDLGVKLSKSQAKLVELNQDVEALDPSLFYGKTGEFKGLAKMIAKEEDLFSKEEGKGAYARLEKLAEANGMFDETIGNASFKNAEGKSVYEIIKSSYVLSEAKKLNDDNYTKQLLSGKDKNNDLNNRNYKFISKNYLLNTFPGYVKNLTISIIDGLRKEDDKTSTEGVVFGDYDGRTYLIQGLAYFADVKKGLTKYIFRQNEAANTAYVADLPVQQLSEEGKPNRIILEALYDNFKKEFERIDRETKAFGKKGNVVYKGYNDKATGRAFDFTEFQYIKDINPELYSQIVNLAKEGKISELPEQAIQDAISDYLIEGIKRYKKNLEKFGIVKLDANDSIAFNNFMPKNLALQEGAKYRTFDEAATEFYLNDYLMSSSLNELFDGDYALSRKDKGDVYKRHKGAMGSGNSYGTGTHRVAYIKDIYKFIVKEPVNGNLIRIKEVNGDQYIGVDGKTYTADQVADINTADAQSEQSLIHKIYALNALGKLDPRTWKIYKKIIKGQPISDEEQGYLEENKASLNPDKTVTFGMGIYHKTSEHALVRSMISYVPEKSKEKVDALNDELIALLEARDFDKAKLTVITRQLAKLYKPNPMFVYHHNLANQMDIHGIDQIIAESASKGATLIPVDSQSDTMDLSLSMTDVLNEYKRLQVETPTGKDTITDGSQLIQLIDSEQTDETEFTFPDGTTKTLGAIRAEYRALMNSSRSNAFKAAKTYITELADGKIDKSKLDKKLLRSLEASGSDDVILELFGKPYNFNMSNMVDKAEQIVLAHFSKGVLNQKVTGGKVSLVSDAGIELIIDKQGNVVPYQEVIKNPEKYKNYSSRKLAHNKKDDKGNVFSECLLSERMLTKHGLKVGDEIPEELLKALGYRIPTQDKHSMMAFKIVGLLPNYMEGVGIFPQEIVHLSGADFDIDSEFMQIHDYWMKNGKPVKYGTEKTIDDKWDAFIYYKTNIDKEFKMSYSKALEAQGFYNMDMQDPNRGIKRDTVKTEALRLTLIEFGLPTNKTEFAKLKDPENLNNGVINNRILDARIAMLTNSEMLKKIAYTPSSTKSLSDVVGRIDKLKAENKEYTVDTKNLSTSDINGKFDFNTKASAGKAGIGVVANKLQVFSFLAKVSSKLTENAFKFQIGDYIGEGYKFLSSSGHRIADTLSTILSVMTDNAKDPIAGRLNLSLELLNGFTELISQGLPEYEAGLIINQPIIQLYSNLKQARGYAVKNKIEEGFTKDKTIAAAIAAYKLRDSGGVNAPGFSAEYKTILAQGMKDYKTSLLTTLDMENVLNGTTTASDALEAIQINALMQFTQIEAQSDILANINTLLKLNQGLSTSFSDLHTNLMKALEELGVAHKFNVREEAIDEPTKIVDIYPALKADPLTVGNVRKALEVLEIGKKLFISQTDTFRKSLTQLKDILNKSYANKKETTKDVSRLLLGYISTRGYLHLLKETISNPEATQRVKDLYTKRLSNINGSLIYKELSGDTLAEQLTKLKGSEDEVISKNAIVKYLQVEANDSLELVTSKTFAKESKETISVLLDSFKDLYNNPKTKDFAINMFNYLIVKDNLEFRNNTFIKYIAPFMFDKLSTSLDITLEELSKKDGKVEKVLGDSMDNISYNFRKLYATYIGNRFGKLKYKKLEGSAGFTVTNDEITFDVFQNLNPEMVELRKEYIKEQKAALEEKNGGFIKKDDKIDYSFEKFPTLKEGTKANRAFIDSVFDHEIINGNKLFIFPQFAIFNSGVYELVEYTTYDGNKTHPKNESVHKGNSAIYVPLETIGDKKISPFSNETYEDALQQEYEIINASKLENKESNEDTSEETDEESPAFKKSIPVIGQESIDFDENKEFKSTSSNKKDVDNEQKVKSCLIGPF